MLDIVRLIRYNSLNDWQPLIKITYFKANIISDSKHPLLELLAFSKMDSFIDMDNFKIFLKIKEALAGDGKSPLLVNDDGIRAGFNESLANTDDLYDDQTEVIAGIISVWSVSTTLPLLNDLNEHKHTADIAHYYSGNMKDAQLFFENINEFTADMPQASAAAALAVLNDWSNTAALFVNVDELKSALQLQASPKAE